MTLPFSKEEFDSYLTNLSYRESSNKADAENSYGYIGLWQTGAAALEDAGLIKKGASKLGNKALNDPNNWTIKGGKAAFLADPELQKKAIIAFTEKNYKTLRNRGLINDTTSPSEVAGYLAQAHLVGAGGVGKRKTDAYGTTTDEYDALGQASIQKVSLQSGVGEIIAKEGKEFVRKTGEATWLPDPRSVTNPNDLDLARIKSSLNSPTTKPAWSPNFETNLENNAGGIGTINLNQIQLPSIPLQYDTVMGNLNSGFSDAFSAGFNREVLPKLKAVYYGLDKFIQIEDPNYNPYNDIKGTPYEQYGDWFQFSPNADYTIKLKARLDSLNAQGRKYSEAGWVGVFGQFTGSLADPLTLFPFMAVVKGGSIIYNAARIGIGSAAATSINEYAYHTFDPTRTHAESEFNILSSGVMGALFGGIGTKLEQRALSKGLDKGQNLGSRLGSVTDNVIIPKKDLGNIIKTIGGDTDLAETSDDLLKNVDTNINKTGEFKFKTDTESFDIKTTNPIFGAAFKGLSSISPVLRVLNSASPKAKQLLQDLAPVYLRTEREFLGKAKQLSVVDELKGEMARVSYLMSDINENFAHLKKNGGGFTRGEFYNEVIKSIRNRTEHPNLYINKAAISLSKYFNDMADILIKYGLLPEDFATTIKNKPGYFTRLWDFDKIRDNPNTFKEVILNAVAKQNPELESAQIEKITTDIMNSFLDGSTSSIYRQSIYKSGELKQKVLDLDDNLISQFTINDIREVLHTYAVDVNRELILKKRYGSTDLKKQLQEILDEYDGKIKEVKTNKEAAKLIKERDDTISDLEAIRDQFLGRYAQIGSPGWSKIEKSMKTINTLAYLGSAAIYSVVDAMKLIGVARLSNIPFVKQTFKYMDKLFTDIKLTKEDYKYLGVSLDQLISERGIAISTGSDILTGHSKFDRFIRNTNDNFFLLNGMSIADNILKKLDVSINASNIINDIIKLKAGKLSEERLLDLRKFGIDDKEADTILSLFEKHKTVIDGVTFPNLHKWGVEGLPFTSRLLKAVDEVVTAPTIGETPLILKRTSLGRMVGQFRGYMFGQFHKSFLPMLQNMAGVGTTNTMVMASRSMSSILLGSFVYMTLQKLDGKEIETDPKKLILEGIDRGGMMPILMDGSHILDDYGAGIGAWLGTTPISRLKDVSTAQKILGPSGRFIDTILPSIGRVATGNAGPDEYKALAKAIPGYNLLLWRHWTSQYAQSIGENKP